MIFEQLGFFLFLRIILLVWYKVQHSSSSCMQSDSRHLLVYLQMVYKYMHIGVT